MMTCLYVKDWLIWFISKKKCMITKFWGAQGWLIQIVIERDANRNINCCNFYGKIQDNI